MKRAPAFAFQPAVIAALIVAQVLFVAAYIGHERTIYFWDHAMYIGMARQGYAAFSQNFSAGWGMFRHSLAQNYNLVFALPSFASFSLFGPSRLVFILTNFFVFFLAYEVAVAFLLRRALNFSWSTALAVSFIASCLIPPLWLPLFEGYPDIGAAAGIVFAAGLGWNGTERQGFVRRALGVGFLLGGAVLLRRHFVYAAMALLAALALLETREIWRTPKNRGRSAGIAAGYFLLCGFGFIATLALTEFDFLRTALTTDYGALYHSYTRPAAVFLRFAAGGFGIGLLLAGASGLILLARMNEAGRKLALLITFYLVLWLAIWCLGPDQMGHHYILHALPLFVAVGLAGWFAWLSRKSDTKKYLIGGLLCLGLAANSVWALWLSPRGVWPNDNGTPGLLSAARPPVVRPDYDELHRLADYLRRATGPQDRIMVVGSSFVFNLDLLYRALLDVPGAGSAIARFTKNPEIDHEEPAPFDVFAGSNVYLVPEPPQYHLDPDGQRVIRAAVNQFPPPPARAALFHADNIEFHLADGVIVKVWRRDAWTPAALHEALREIRRDGPEDARFDQDWVTVTLPVRAEIFTDARNMTAAAAILDADRDMRLFFDYPLEKGRHRLAFSYASNCGVPHFRLTVLDPGGQTEQDKNLVPAAGTASAVFDISSNQSGFLELDLSTAAATPCRMELRNLRVEEAP